MKALLIGGSGFIGSNIASSLDADDIVYYSRNTSEMLESRGIKHIAGSVDESDKLKELVKDFDTIFYLAGIFDEKDQKHETVTLNGIKSVVETIRKQDKGQKLIFFSAIGTDYGVSEYFRIRRITEDNVNLAKDSLTIKLSHVFGEGDRITGEILKVAASNIRKMPLCKSLAPVAIGDLVSVVKAFLQYKGTIYVSSKEDITLASAVNLVRSLTRGSPVKEVENKRKSKKLLEKMAQQVDIPEWRLTDLTLNFHREITSLYRTVSDPEKYADYLRNVVSKAKA